jgi:hypothetical protein
MYSQLISCGIPLYFMGESGTVCTVTQHVYSANLDQTGNYDDDFFQGHKAFQTLIFLM